MTDINVIDLEVGTKLIEGPITVTVNHAGLDKADCIMDYAGYKVFKGDHTFDYVKDTSAAVVTVKSADQNKVVLHFSKQVKGSNIRLYHSKKNVNDYKVLVEKAAKANDITFEFKDTKLPAGTVKLYLVNSDADAEKLVDYYGIKVPDQTLTCNVVVDETSFAFVSGEFNKNEYIKLKFNKKLDEETAKNTNNYEVKKLKDNTAVNADYTPVNTTVTQNLDVYDLGENKLAAGSTWAVTLEAPQTN